MNENDRRAVQKARKKLARLEDRPKISAAG
jgi:hypothetical protein